VPPWRPKDDEMLRVLTYHRIADPAATPDLNPRLVSAVPPVFERQLDHLVRHYDVVPLAAVLAASTGAPLPGRSVLLTFDDAYADFATEVWPRLRARNLPAVLFVPTAYPDTALRFWWDRVHACVAHVRSPVLEVPDLGSLPVTTPAERRAAVVAIQNRVKSLPHTAGMQWVERVGAVCGEPPSPQRSILSWDELRRLAREGCDLAPHTRTHPLLTRVPPETAREEIAGSIADLERECGPRLPVFAYPSGAHDDAVLRIAGECGIRLAFTQLDGHNAPGRTPPLRYSRTNITRRTTPPVFALRLLRVTAWVDRWRHRPLPAAPGSVR
jgi:peptidoglycan/xylan/chitin deacetylase (PgdA/CDA1 family)